MSRPTMRFVPVKTRDNQAVLMLLGMRERLLRGPARGMHLYVKFQADVITEFVVMSFKEK
ncbi:hypothetical protein [Ensifer adhaerens]|uniref:hypothetical protein n=2 Tax=Ensifer adhaerens TaxID=106592 RepID=UPI001CCD0BFA|nr:hypothetical protein [Ensifer adhaerens]